MKALKREPIITSLIPKKHSDEMIIIHYVKQTESVIEASIERRSQSGIEFETVIIGDQHG